MSNDNNDKRQATVAPGWVRMVLAMIPLCIVIAGLALARAGVLPETWWSEPLSRMSIAASGVVSSLTLALLLMVNAYRRRVDALRRAMGEHETREKDAREKERQYRVLFEDAMQTAYTDLDRLNESLRSQKDYLQAKMEEQNRTSEELRQSEERWRQLVERNPEGIIITRARQILYANGVAVSLVSENPDDVIGHSVLEFLPAQVWARVEQMIRDEQFVYDADPVHLPINAIGDTSKWIEAYSVPIKYRGRFAVQTVIRDVTQRRLAEQALLSYTDRIAALHTIAQSILSDDSPRVVTENALGHLRRLIPLTYASVVEINLVKGSGKMMSLGGDEFKSVLRDEMEGPIQDFGCAEPSSTTPDYLYSPNRSAVQRGIGGVTSHMFMAGVRSFIELPLVIKNEWVGVIYVGSDREDGFTEDDCFVAVDIARMIAVTMHQERIESERLGYERELLNAKERAEEMARLKTTFLTNMSHEIRTPLTGIIGFAQILSEEITGEHSEFVTLIEQSGRRLLDTINSVLDLARLESNRMSMTLEAVDVAEEVRRTARLLTPLADRRSLYIRAEVEDGIVCRLDKTGLNRILNNLIGNAIKFTEDGGVTVRSTRDGADCVIEVTDSGVGISGEFLPHLFDEFRQESTGADRSHEGSGMGLAITRKLVDIMGGKIFVESTKGAGSTFTVRFPILGEPASSDRPPVRTPRHDVRPDPAIDSDGSRLGSPPSAGS